MPTKSEPTRISRARALEVERYNFEGATMSNVKIYQSPPLHLVEEEKPLSTTPLASARHQHEQLGASESVVRSKTPRTKTPLPLQERGTKKPEVAGKRFSADKGRS